MPSEVTVLGKVQVERVSDHANVELPGAWGANEVAVLQLAEAWAPRLSPLGAQVFFVSCGNTTDMAKWLEYTGFPADHVLLDQANAVYDSLRTRRGVARTLLHPYMWLVLPAKLAARGTLRGLGRAMRVWRPKVPQKSVHSFLQGGTFVFRGPRLMWAHRNAVPGDDAPLEQVVEAVKAAAQGVAAPAGPAQAQTQAQAPEKAPAAPAPAAAPEPSGPVAAVASAASAGAGL
ncbi:hypothetical protein HXX76_003216 [Chlamydomonas incerta]|uniref:Uncharacterized protein n=1 Tax=Chlamydomonas incerta TaxID=51695 RepID=A0A835W6U1_CHLIN|nr:hypothetical protein HXX76_003216 [Chlamydomonas incerta]|eukprot:KAG2441595.1 hypothetical protein HXX76_003216 [Chlamydomonas incerta]